MYGHLDKQPEFEGWRSDLGPGRPVYEDGKLYGRGGADDGYAVYASVAAVQELKRQNVPTRASWASSRPARKAARRSAALCGCLRPRLGDVGLVICLDSGAGNYDQLWLTTSLRGMASGTLKVEILTEGCTRAMPRAWCPRRSASCARCWTGWRTAQPAACCPPASTARCRPSAGPGQATAAILGEETYKRFPWAHHDCGGSTLVALPTTTDPVQALLKRTWEPTLSVTGAEGFPRCRTPAMCCAPTRPSSSACACRRWWTPPPACRR
jgi:hypothetical protein